MPRSCVVLLLAPPVLPECGLGVYGELLGEAEASFEATRIMGGSWGGKGDMGEADVWLRLALLALSLRRGDET